jgi:HEAT repeat protein
MVLPPGTGAPAGPGNSARGAPHPWELDPQRTLTGAEAERLVAHVVLVLDERAERSQRRQAIETIWGVRHRAALPALRFVAHNEADEGYVRQSVVRPLLFIGLNDAIGDLLQLLRSPNRDVAGAAWEVLLAQYPEGKAFCYAPWESVEDNETAVNRWEEWWEANKDTFEVKIGPLLRYD